MKIGSSLFSRKQKILYPYTAERRDVLENTLPEAQEISQGRGFCTPRPEGNLEGRGTTNAMQCITLQCDDILPACKCLHCTYLHHFPRKDVFLIFVLGSVSKILSLVHSLESRECIGYYDLWRSWHTIDHPCCQWIPRNTSQQGSEYWHC